MRPIDAVITFLTHIGGVSGITVADLENPLQDPAVLQSIADPVVNKAIRNRLIAVLPEATQQMTANRWFPLPSRRSEVPPWHTLPGAAIYYLIEAAIHEHGLDNTVAGILQGALLPDVTAFLKDLRPTDINTDMDYLLAVTSGIAYTVTEDLVNRLTG